MFSTTIMALNSGFERRNINWETVRAAYNVQYGIKTIEQMDAAIAFFYARWGRGYSFRYKDWGDFETGTQILGTGDGVKTQFQLIKVYESGGFSYTRQITKPVSGTLVNVAVDAVDQVEGTDFSVNYTTGILTFVTAPADTKTVSIGNCEFDVHARFDTDQLNITQDMWETESVPNIAVVEVKELS